MDFLICTVLVGAGATTVMDLWMIARKKLFRVPAPDYALVGRWIAWLAAGRLRHERIADTPAVRGERWIGWATHFLVGIAFASILLGICGLAWLRDPTPGPALLVGVATVAAPFLVLQPAMGAGIAASRTPRPSAARLQSLVTHGIFGLGLYAAGIIVGSLRYTS